MEQSVRLTSPTLFVRSNATLVDVVEEGFDAIVRTGQPSDSRLMSRNVGRFKLKIVASPDYLARCGVPKTPDDLAHHQCLHQRSPSTDKLRPWPFARSERQGKIVLPGLEIACLPPFAIRNETADGLLVSILEEWVGNQFNVLWPASRQITPKLRAFVDFMAEHLQPP